MSYRFCIAGLVVLCTLGVALPHPTAARAYTTIPGYPEFRAAEPAAAQPDTAVSFYRPRPEDFRPCYEADSANAEVQSWEQYWRWVTIFYAGNIIARGWLDECAHLIEGIEEHPRRTELITLLNDLGQRAAGEWAKDNGVRLISSRDVFGWREDLRAAVRLRPATEDRITALVAALQSVSESLTDRLDKPGSEFVPAPF